MSHGPRTLVAMSGGVDSSVAAALLVEQGHDVVGVTLHLWDASGAEMVGRCCAPEDRDDARRSCEALGIPHYVVDERDAFRAEVVSPFVEAYARGTTPSPCVACNQHVKLGRFDSLARSLGCERIATGHYARIERDPASGAPMLLRGRDASKDQSYFLYGVSPAILARLELPLGSMTKAEAREHGRRLGVPNWDKPDSQELCFVPDGDVRGFVAREEARAGRDASRLGGRIIDETGAELARHDGVAAFTVGQRKGLGLGGGGARYVLRIVPDTHDVVVGDARGLARDHVHVGGARWIGEAPAARAMRCEVQVRHHAEPAPATLTPCDGGFVARFDSPVRAAAPGQAAVVFDGARVLGGGTIVHGCDEASCSSTAA